MGKKVFLMSVPRTTATMISEWRSESGERMNKTKIGDCKDTICALWSSKYAGLANGLSYKPWIENGSQVVENNIPLTLQDREERKWNLPKGYLTNRAWKRGDSLKADNMPYFQTKTWKLNDGTTVLDLHNFDDAMLYYIALDSKFVANSEAELKARKWPYATHYIALENEAEELKYIKNKRKIDAMARLASEDLTYPRKKAICYTLGLAAATGDISEELSFNLLSAYIEADKVDVNNNVDKFLVLVDLLKTDAGRAEFEAKLLLKKGLDSRVIYEKSDSYVWNKSTGPITLGETYKDAVAFILNPKKDTLIKELENEIKSKVL